MFDRELTSGLMGQAGDEENKGDANEGGERERKSTARTRLQGELKIRHQAR